MNPDISAYQAFHDLSRFAYHAIVHYDGILHLSSRDPAAISHRGIRTYIAVTYHAAFPDYAGPFYRRSLNQAAFLDDNPANYMRFIDLTLIAGGDIIQYQAIGFQDILRFACIFPPSLYKRCIYFVSMFDEPLDGIGYLQLIPPGGFYGSAGLDYGRLEEIYTHQGII